MASSQPGGSGPGPPRTTTTSAMTTTPKKKEKWLVTRKTWRYMADAGKLLIPESLRKGKDMKEYTDEDMNKLEDHFQKVCDQQQDFIEWEGPRQDPRLLLASNRVPAPPPQPPQQSHETGPKFRLVLPVGQAPPPGYVQVGKRTLPMGELPLDEFDHGPQNDYVQLPSGLVLQELPAIYLTERDWYARRSSSPPDSGLLSPEDFSFGDEEQLDSNITISQAHHGHHSHHVESGIGSGADSVSAVKIRNVGIQTDPIPDEFFRIQEEEKRREEEEKRRKEEEERLAREAEERELEAAMGDSVMRYLKMVRRNSKSSDQKKAERFRSMNYDPTLRNIKAKYLNKEENVEGFKKSMEVQVGESLLELLKKCQTPIDPPVLPSLRKSSNTTASELSDHSVMSPQRRLSGVRLGEGGQNLTSGGQVVNAAGPEVERDFYAHLYSGDMTALESGAAIQEDYYNYLDSWYRAQKGLVSPTVSSPRGTGPGSGSSQQTIYIPVDALQNLRASMPALVTCAAASGSTNSVSRSTNSLLGKSPGQSFLSSVISLRPFAGSSAPSGNVGPPNASGTRIMPKKLWRTRSKSQGRSSVSSQPIWVPLTGSRWQHVTNRVVVLESAHLLMLHEFERIALQKMALQKLNSSDLGVTTRIPKDSSDKTKGRTYLLKKKVLPRWDSNRDKSKEPGSGPVFGVPLGQCVELPSTRKRSTCALNAPTATGIENIPSSQDELLLSPVTKASRSDSRASFGSVNMAGSTESLFDFRRQSLGLSSQSSAMLDTITMDEMAELSMSGTFSSPCVPTVVMMCIRHLEQFGLHTVGIFRVSSSKKRVKQLREEFDRGGQITLSMETGVHDVATLLKEFFRDLPEPLIPKEVQSTLLAVQKLKNTQEQIIQLQHIMQLLPLINRDTLYVLLQFLGLVAEHANDDSTDEAGNVISGNKMDSLNLATLFAPNLMHSFNNDDLSKGGHHASMTLNSERMDHVSALKLLIDRRDLIYQVPSVELNDAYVYLSDHFPDVLDALLRKRSALAGIEIPEEFQIEEESNELDLRRRPSKGPGLRAETNDKVDGSDDGGQASSGRHWGFRRDQRGSDRRRRVSTIQAPELGTSEPSRGTSSLRFHVPTRSGRKTSMAEVKPIPTNTVSSPQGREAIVYSPASSSFSMASASSARGSTPCSDMFFASGNTTPSHMMSPPPTHSHFGSPTFLSPPISPPPLTTVRSSPQPDSATESATPIILSPVPKSPQPKSKGNVPHTVSPMSSLITSNPMSTYLSVSGQRIPAKSKTDDLERYIAEIEASEAKEGSNPTPAKKYTRRRYTDNRHPTTELPDMTSASTGALNTTSTASLAQPGNEKPALVRRRTQQLA